MNISVSRNGVELGQWPAEAIQTLYAQGQLLPTDVYWKEGMTEWRSLSELIKPPQPPAAMAQPKRLSSPPPKKSGGCFSLFIKALVVLAILAVLAIGGLIVAWPSMLHALLAKAMEKQIAATPFMQGDNMRVDSITLTANNVIVFHCTFLHIPRELVKQSDLDTMRRETINQMRANPQTTMLMNLGVSAEMDLYDERGISIADIRVTSEDLK